MGGKGGNGGVITLLGPLDFSKFFNISQSSPGKEGSSGQQGKGGLGGRHGYLATVQINPGVNGRDGFIHGKKIISLLYQGKAKDGRSGRRGLNDFSPESTNTTEQNYSLGNHYSPLNIFRNYARKNIANPITKSSLLKFLHKLDNEDIYRKNLPLVTDLDEFLDLDSQYFQENSEGTEFLDFYTNYTRKIVRILNQTKTSEADKNAFKYLYSASLSRIIRIEEKHFEGILISDMTTYLSLLQSNAELLREQPAIFNALSLITNGTKDHTNQTEMYCWSTFDFAFKEVSSDLIQYKLDLDTSIEQLLTEILQLKNLNSSSTITTQLLTTKRQDLKTKFVELNAYTFLRIGSRFLRFFGPLSLAVKSGVVIGAKALGLSHEEVMKSQTKRYMDMQKRINLKICRYNVNQLNAFLGFLNDCKDKLDEIVIGEIRLGFDHAIQETEKKMEEERIQISISESKNTTIENLKSVSISNAHDFIRLTKVRLSTALAATMEFLKNDNSNSSQISVGIIQEIIKSFLISPGLYMNIRSDPSKVEEVMSVLIEFETEKKSEELDRFSFWVEQEMSSIREEFSKQMGFDTVGESITYQSGLNELTSTFNISRKLSEARIIIRNQFEFCNQSNPEIALRYQKLDEGFTMLIRVYEITVNFYRKSKLGNIIAKFNSMESIGVRTEDVKNKIQCVELVIVSNMFIGQYHMILNSLKMLVFPFAEFYVRNVSLPDKLVVQYGVEEGQCKVANSTVLVYDMAQAALQVIGNIRTEVGRYKNNAHEEASKYLKVGVFDGSKTSKPFYIWEHHLYKFAIEKLLSGEIVVFKADILKCPHVYDAVKLVTLDIKFTTGATNNYSFSDNKLMLNELAEALNHFRVVMTHLGNSVYRYDGKYYTITSQPIVFEFSFQKNSDGVPKYKNKEYEMMISGDILLSPYAMWKIQFIPLESSGDFTVLSNFNKLETFHFDLQLHGNGSYVKRGLSNIFKMNEFYEVDKTVVDMLRNVKI